MIIVTHQNPDPDAIGAVWLLTRFGGKAFEGVEIKFVPAGETFRKAPVDIDSEIIHVDTGLGKFDHHQTSDKTCAAKLVFEDLAKKRRDLAADKALIRVVDFILATDHFGAYFWPEPTSDRYIFMLEEMLNGYKLGGHGNDTDLVRLGSMCLDGAYNMMKVVVEAEAEIKEKGQEFESKWGKALALLTSNDAVIKLGLKQGYKVVMRKDPHGGNIRIKAAPVAEINLRPVYEVIKAKDKTGTWYFHPSGHMVLNGSSKNKEQRPSSLSLEEVIEILKSA